VREACSPPDGAGVIRAGRPAEGGEEGKRVDDDRLVAEPAEWSAPLMGITASDDGGLAGNGRRSGSAPRVCPASVTAGWWNGRRMVRAVLCNSTASVTGGEMAWNAP